MDDPTLWVMLRFVLGISAQVLIFLTVDHFLKGRENAGRSCNAVSMRRASRGSRRTSPEGLGRPPILDT
jgi:hypothetical protein